MSSLTVALIQTDLAWENKRANLDMLRQKIEGLSQRTEIIILPEMFNTGFSMNVKELAEPMHGQTMQWMKETASGNKVIITGSLIIYENDHYFNRLVWMLPNGKCGVYDKRHLFSYANEHRYFHAGNRKLIASVKGWKINLQICYDLRFPLWARQPVDTQNRYDVLINVANWPQNRRIAWNTLLRARAIENQAYVVGVNRVGEDANKIIYKGDSTIIDPMGEIVYCQSQQEDVFTYTLQKENIDKPRARFPFLDDADPYLITE